MEGEHVWVRHLLDDHMTCLPVAEVDIKCDLGKVTSKAAVIGNHLDQGRYILGNQTAALLQEIKENCSSYVGKVNTVVTRSKTRQSKEKEILRESDQNAEQTELNMEEITDNSENEEILPPVDHCSPINLVTQIKSSTFIAEQRKGPSEYTSPMILVETPGRDPRPCIDYRKLNEMTRTEFYSIPNIEQRVETVAAAKFITLIDFTKGYWQIPLRTKAQKIAKFATSFGVYRPLRMPFGLKNSPYISAKL
ncbi:retrovirus-related Pol polyprotein from transposon 17.6 [Trichonephila clavata]|uniref:Retrovirus-related Pol polyprotein from transposon 17.6 n=1 Tax=Trichonephila clavata TaxID=2740835 RepID=A0A8X6M148_TRICU|nr:retrovirus-related Pol polyprotein from transposon 17.6 [Trichonephila clavata]